MKLYKEKANVISEKPIWIFMYKGWLYTGESLLKLVFIVITQWKQDKHLAG